MIKSILVSVDGSPYAKSCFDYAAEIARAFSARLMGLHVVDSVSLEGSYLHDLSGSLGFEPFLNFSTRMKEVLEARGKEILKEFEENCAKAKIAHETTLAYGVVAGEICAHARGADLVVIGQRGVNEKFEFGMLGSATEAIIRRSPKPVLIAPKHHKPITSPLLAYDGSPAASNAMARAAELAKTMGLPLTVLTVVNEQDDETAANEAISYLSPYGLKTEVKKLVAGDAAVAIESWYNAYDHDLLFMGASHRSRLVEMVLGSTTEHVMRAIQGPFFLER